MSDENKNPAPKAPEATKPTKVENPTPLPTGGQAHYDAFKQHHPNLPKEVLHMLAAFFGAIYHTQIIP